MNQPTKEVYYYEDGSVESELWYLNDERHRVDGPAVTYYYEDGSVESELWWLNDECLSKEDFLVSDEHQLFLADQEIERILEGGVTDEDTKRIHATHRLVVDGYAVLSQDNIS